MAGVALASGLAWGQQAPQSYFEFGTVVALRQRTVDLQVFDPQRQRMVQHSFALSKETRADVMHVGDTVEVIFSAGVPGADWSLDRLLVLHGGVPQMGPAPAGGAVATTPAPAQAGAAPVATVPTRKAVSTGNAKAAPPATVPARSAANLGRSTTTARGASTSNVALGGATVSGKVPAATDVQPVGLGGTPPAKVPAVASVGLGVSKVAANGNMPTVRAIQQEAPGEQCDRDRDWAAQPMRMAVLDFRFPTEREESRDEQITGGGSGTAVADLVYNRLAATQPEFALSRGDRQKLYRMDFAGAARMGRQIGVDAVLLGTFVPVDVVQPDPDFPVPTQAYTLRAGVVETCTGELMYRLDSITCPTKTSSGAPLPIGTVCPGSQISVKDAQNPSGNEAAFRIPIENLLLPLEHNGTPAGRVGSAGVVTAVGDGTVTFRLTSGASVHTGQAIAVHAFRLAKIVTTRTIHRYQDEEIGRITVQRVSGGTATGTYAGDLPARAGDTAELIPD